MISEQKKHGIVQHMENGKKRQSKMKEKDQYRYINIAIKENTYKERNVTNKVTCNKQKTKKINQKIVKKCNNKLSSQKVVKQNKNKNVIK